MRPIDADELVAMVCDSLNNNPHTDPKVRANHRFEHEHFLYLIEKARTIHYQIDEVEGHFE